MQTRPMRFHWFWSHISMILGALSGLAMVVNALEAKTTIAPALQWAFYVDIVFAVIYISVCLWAFALRNKRTPTTWYLMLTPTVLNISYMIALIFMYSKLNIDATNQMVQVIVYLICWIFTLIYYIKRRPMFFGMNTDYFTSQSSAEPKAAFYDDDAHAGDIPVPPPSEFSQMPVDFPKYCDNCGTECENWVKFCPACGCKTFSIWIKKPLQVINDPELLKKADKGARRYILKKRLPVISLGVLCIVLMASTAGMSYKHVEYMSNSKEQYNELEERYESVLEKMRQLQIDNGKLTNERNELQYENAKLTEDNTILSDGLDDTLNTTMFFINSVGFVVHGHKGYHKLYCEYVKDSEFIQIHNKEYCENTLGLKPHSCWEDDDLSE